MPEPEPPLKIVPSSTYQLRIELMWSSTARMKQALHCCGVSGTPTLNHTGELNAAFWVDEQVRELLREDLRVLVASRSSASLRPQPVIVSTTRPTSWRTLDSRCGVPRVPRKYFWATMLVAFCDQVTGNSTSRCSKALPPSL